jgi:transcriptional regulator with XRE-family HTH domain
METFGELIRYRREEKGLLLRQVASALEIDQALLSKIERGRRNATKQLVIKLSDVLEIDKNELLIQFFSDKIAHELVDIDIGKDTLKVAEQKIDYFKQKRNAL